MSENPKEDSTSESRKLYLNFGIGFSDYEMSYLKGIEKFVLQNTEDPIIKEKFGMSSFYQFELSAQKGNGCFGLYLAYFSARSQIIYSKESPDLGGADHYVQAIEAGVIYEYQFLEVGPVGFWGGLNAGYKMNITRINRNNIEDYPGEDRNDYTGLEVLSISPKIKCSYTYDSFQFSVRFGYNFDTAETKYEDEYDFTKNYTLSTFPDWSGWATIAMISVRLK